MGHASLFVSIAMSRFFVPCSRPYASALSFPPNPYTLPLLPRFSSISPIMSAAAEAAATVSSHKEKATGVAVLWYKHDLRVDDHPGLVTAASLHRTLIPLYVFDRRILSRFSDEMLELVIFAVEDLRRSLMDQGSNLMIKFGSSESVIRELIKEVQATSIFIEEEVEYDLRKMVDVVKQTIETMSFLDGNPKIIPWQTPQYDIKDLPASHDDFKKLKVPLTSALAPPLLPGVEMNLEWGLVPTLDDLKTFMNVKKQKTKDSWTFINGISGKALFGEEHVGQVKSINSFVEGLKSAWSAKSSQSYWNYDSSQRKRSEKSMLVEQKKNSVGNRTNVASNASPAYCRYLERTARDDWQDVLQNLLNYEGRVGASLGTLFGSMICLGIISRRRLHYEIVKYENKRKTGSSDLFAYSAVSVAAAADAVSSMEWYWLMALKSQNNDEGKYSIRIWRWNGYLIQYAVVGDEGPAILLVHGFGAFLEHFRDNMHDIATVGNHVWAITLLGFGKSEKPSSVAYTELMWAELLRDFIIEVVGEPVHLVGNSIGGYFVAIVARFWPDIAKSVVLVNTAGNIIPGYSSVVLSKDRRTSWLTWLGARFLLFYMRLNIKKIVQKCYPTRTERADDWLINQMLRASYDPGVLQLLESIFSFNFSIPLNFLLEGLEERVLVIQGMKDPLSKSKSKLALLREHCAGVAIREVDAGHCPHDEQPELVNAILCEWLITVEGKFPVTAPFS